MKIYLTYLFLVYLIVSPAQSNDLKDQILLKEARDNFGNGINGVTYAGDKRPRLEMIRLGHKLFFEKKLSADNTVSCSTCHLPELYGTDGKNKSIGVFGRPNPRNAPTILNAAFNFSQHWRGDRKDVEEQATKAFLGKVSFGLNSQDEFNKKLEQLPGYIEQFSKIFGKDFRKNSLQHAGTAIGAYERTLILPSKFDDYLEGNIHALNEKEKNGLKKFMKHGCVACHTGQGIGGNDFQKFGVTSNYWKLTGSQDIDLGRFEVTQNPEDKYYFKIPSLRNVEKTSPYFHDGSIKDLARAIKIMGKLQLDIDLPEKDVEDIEHFLKTLTSKQTSLGKFSYDDPN